MAPFLLPRTAHKTQLNTAIKLYSDKQSRPEA